jgi:hypothetical protein
MPLYVEIVLQTPFERNCVAGMGQTVSYQCVDVGLVHHTKILLAIYFLQGTLCVPL